MTVTTTTNSVTYSGNGSTFEFDVPFQFFEPADLIVTERVVATGAETVMTLTTDYTVMDGDGDVGKVIANSAPAATVTWNIRRTTSQTQLIDYTDHDPFPAETHETGLDRVTLIAQDSASEAARSLTFPSTDNSILSAVVPNSVLRASKYLAFDATGEPIATAGPTGDSGVPVSSFISGQLFDDADAATARGTLVAAGTGDDNTFTGQNAFNGRVSQSKGADIASADPLVLGTDGNYFVVTGTTNIASMTVPAGTFFVLEFAAALTLTHHAANLSLPGGANITTAAGDRAVCFAEAADQVTVVDYILAARLPSSGRVVQVVHVEDGEFATGTTTIPLDDTIPQSSEGTQFLEATITPTNASNFLLIEAQLYGSHAVNGIWTTALFRDAAADALTAVSQHRLGNETSYFTLRKRVVAGTTSPTTFKVHAGSQNAGTFRFNGAGGVRIFGGVANSAITISEIEA